MEKLCPILQAGKMIARASSLSNQCPIRGEAKVSVSISYEMSSECMRENCEWYLNGCPAHPTA